MGNDTEDQHNIDDLNEGDEDHKGEPKKDFVPSKGLTTNEATALLQEWGKNELQEKSTPKWVVYLQQLKGPMPIMIWIAIAVEAGIQNWIDMGILLGIQFANATIGWYESTKAADAVAALKKSLKPVATVKRDGTWSNIDATLLVPGDLVLLGAGSAVPADCLVNHGQIDVDQSGLTGESLPVTMYKGDSVKMGSTVTRGEVEATVDCTGSHTFFGKTATMLQSVDGLGNLQKILLRIMLVLVALSLSLCFIAMMYIIFSLDKNFKEALEFTIVLLVASIPIAIEIVCTTTLALGSRALSSHGAIVTRLISIEEMAGMNMLCSDKTGTLTLNKMVIQDECPTWVPGMDLQECLRMAALAAKWKEPPRDALDTMVLGAADLPSLDVYEQVDFMPFDPTVKRTEGTLRTKDGRTFKTTKGAPHIILKLIEVNADQVHKEVEEKVHEYGLRGIRCLAVARTNPEGQWEMVGVLTFLDPPRPDTKETIERAMEFGVDVKMITGDHSLIAKETARVLGMGQNIRNSKGLPSMAADGKVPKDLGKQYGKMILEADGFAEVFPEHKYLIVEALRQEGFAVGMTGDGVNDAPALKRADVGVAVSGATDAARAAADIVLTQPGLSVIVEAIVISREIFQRIKSFINYRIACTLQLLVFFFIAVLTLEPHHFYDKNDIEIRSNGAEEEWPDYFRLPVIFLMLITLLNDGTLITIGYDLVRPSQIPEKWNLRALFTISIVLAGVAMGSSMLLLWAALDSWNTKGVFHAFGLPSMPYGQITTMIYLKVSLSDFLTLFSARTHEGFFFTQRPANLLMGGACFSLGLSTLLSCIWPSGDTDDVKVEGLARGDYNLWPLWIWIYCIICWWLQDAAKVGVYHLMHKFDIFQIHTGSLVNIRETHAFEDPEHPSRATAAGHVPKKLLERKVENAVEALKRVSAGGETSTEKVKQSLNLVRNSIQQGDVETGGTSVKDAVGQLEEQMQKVPEAQKSEIAEHIEDVKKAAAQVARVSAAIQRQSIQRASLTRGSKP